MLIDGLWLMVWLGGQRIGRNQWIDPSRSAQSMKIFVPHGNGHQGLQRLASVEGGFINQVARMPVSWIPDSFLSLTHIVPEAQEQSSHVGRDGSCAWSQHPLLPLSKASHL